MFRVNFWKDPIKATTKPITRALQPKVTQTVHVQQHQHVNVDAQNGDNNACGQKLFKESRDGYNTLNMNQLITEEDNLLMQKYALINDKYDTILQSQQFGIPVKSESSIAVHLAQKKNKHIIKDLRQTLKTEIMKAQQYRAECMQLKDEVNDFREWRDHYLYHTQRNQSNSVTFKDALKVMKQNVSSPSFQNLLPNDVHTDNEETLLLNLNNTKEVYDEVIEALSDRLVIVKDNYMVLEQVVSNKDADIDHLTFELEQKKEMILDLIAKLNDKPLPPTPIDIDNSDYIYVENINCKVRRCPKKAPPPPPTAYYPSEWSDYYTLVNKITQHITDIDDASIISYVDKINETSVTMQEIQQIFAEEMPNLRNDPNSNILSSPLTPPPPSTSICENENHHNDKDGLSQLSLHVNGNYNGNNQFNESKDRKDDDEDKDENKNHTTESRIASLLDILAMKDGIITQHEHTNQQHQQSFASLMVLYKSILTTYHLQYGFNQYKNIKCNKKMKKNARSKSANHNNTLSYYGNTNKIKIHRNVSLEAVRNRIKENMDDIAHYLYNSMKLQYHDTDIDICGTDVKIIRFDFHDKKSDNMLYGVATRINYELVMQDIMTTKEIADKYEYKMNELALPHSPRFTFNSMITTVNDMVFLSKDRLKNRLKQICSKCKWENIPIYRRKRNKRRMTLSYRKKEFNELIQQCMDNEETTCMIPMIMFTNCDATQRHLLQFILIQRIEENIDIGIAFNFESGDIEISGIHLNVEDMKRQHQFTSPQHINECKCFDQWRSHLTDLNVFGNLDDEDNKVKDAKQRYETLKNSLNNVLQNAAMNKFDVLAEIISKYERAHSDNEEQRTLSTYGGTMVPISSVSNSIHPCVVSECEHSIESQSQTFLSPTTYIYPSSVSVESVYGSAFNGLLMQPQQPLNQPYITHNKNIQTEMYLKPNKYMDYR